MTIEIKGNMNYAATVVEVPQLEKLPNSDRLYSAKILGYEIVTDSSWIEREGEKAVLFVAETQLSDQLAAYANLYRHQEKNSDQKESGYLEDNRRVRAIRLRGNPSNGLLLPVEQVANAFKVKPSELIGSFDTINGAEVCRKYELVVKLGTQPQSQAKKAFKRVIGSQLPEHYDTANIRFMQNVAPEDTVIITQKAHGSSVRIGSVLTKRKLTWRDKIAQFFKIPVVTEVYDSVAGSRRVIKDIHDPYQGEGFYGVDLWGEALKQHEHKIPEGFVVYGELVGYLPNGAAIQKGFTYSARPGTFDLYVYRVAVVTHGNDIVDLSWDQMRAWCERHDFNTVPELARMTKAEFELEKEMFWEKNFLQEYQNGQSYTDTPIALSEGGTGLDEGIALRVESALEPRFYKMKNASFLGHETKLLDEAEVDTESAA